MGYTQEQIRLKAAHSKAPKKEREPSVISERQQAYADAIMTGANVTTACAVSGYHPTTVGNEMRNERVQQILAEARKEVSDLTTIKRLDVLNTVLASQTKYIVPSGSELVNVLGLDDKNVLPLKR